MEIFWVNLDVCFKSPLAVFDETNSLTKSRANGFIQDIGCTAENIAESKQIIIGYLEQNEWLAIKDVEIVFEFNTISPEEVDSEIYGDEDICESLISDPLNKGIWYHSGRGFYSDDEKVDLKEVVVKPLSKEGTPLDQ